MFNFRQSPVAARRRQFLVSTVQRLEQRRLLAGIAFDNATGVVSILGSNGNDTAWVTSPNPSQVQISLINVQSLILPLSSVLSIRFDGYDGDDFLQVVVNIPVTANGHGGSDTLNGGPANDRLFGGNDNDSLTGGNGDDLLSGDNGADVLWGQWGRDQLYGGEGDDRLDGGDWDDICGGGNGNDNLLGGAGNDQMFGDSGNDSISGDAGNDYIVGGNEADTLLGGDGVDYVFGGDGNDLIDGNPGDDQLNGQAGADQIRGGDGNDFVAGNEGDDLLWGDAGSDVLYGYGDHDTIRGGSGPDFVYGGTGNDTLYGEADRDYLFGEAGADLLWGDDGADVLVGGVDNDTLLGGAGDDALYGEAGNDVLLGLSGRDQLFGGDGEDDLYGNDDPDLLNGGAGHDGLFGGIGGGDTLTGGTGFERFLLWAGDTITDLGDSEARLLFVNASGVWNESEVRAVDQAFRALHLHRGHARLLLDSLDNDPVRYVKYSTLPNGSPAANSISGSGPAGNLDYTRELRIADWDETSVSRNDFIKYTVIHEIGHSWDSLQEIGNRRPNSPGIWNEFVAISGWRNTNPNSGLYSLSGDGTWWHLTASAFVDPYSKTNPREDWSTIWEILFDPTKAAARAQVQSKVDKVLQLMAAI